MTDLWLLQTEGRIYLWRKDVKPNKEADTGQQNSHVTDHTKVFEV
jgi:hypothetical protein